MKDGIVNSELVRTVGVHMANVLDVVTALVEEKMEIVEVVHEGVAVVERVVVKGDENKVKKILMLSLYGALGAGISGLMGLLFLLPLKQIFSIPGTLWLLIQGLTFVPLGYLIGLSIAYYTSALPDGKRKLIIGGGIGGALYGAFNFFSIAGGILGLALLSIGIAGSVEKASGSMKRGIKVVVAFFVWILIIFILNRLVLMLSGGEVLFLFTILDPLRATLISKFYSIILLISAFYLLNLSILTALWGEIGT